jgi:hypothetical protein
MSEGAQGVDPPVLLIHADDATTVIERFLDLDLE